MRSASILRAAALLLWMAASPSAAGNGNSATEALREAALQDTLAWELSEAITTELGPRMAGTAAEARARDWALRRLKSLGFSNVRVETFRFPLWLRGREEAEIVSPFPQRLVVTALGNSGATPPEGLTAEVVGFDSLAELESSADETVRGKIVFVSHAMVPSQDVSGYVYYGPARRAGPSIASRKGAAAIVIRSLGTDYHRNPHAGGQSWAKGVRPIPAGALSLPDAEQLQRILRRGKPVTMHLTLTPRSAGLGESGNVIAEIPGRDSKAGVVLIGGHLDSWDLGTGAVDDAAGIAVTTAAAKRILDAGRPLRTIRLVWFGAEEAGLFGGADYLARHGGEKHAVIAESDGGADRVWRFDSKASAGALPAVKAIAGALAPLGVVQGPTDQASGSDIEALSASGVPTIQLQQNRTRYFDLHHTPDDTLDKIDPVQLRQNVAAWTAMLSIAANAPVEFGPVPRAE